MSKLGSPLELSSTPCCHTPQSTAHLLFGWRCHEIVLRVRQAHHHGLDPVLAPTGQDAKEVDAKCARQFPSPSHQVELLQKSQVEARPPYKVLQAQPGWNFGWRVASALTGGGDGGAAAVSTASTASSGGCMSTPLRGKLAMHCQRWPAGFLPCADRTQGVTMLDYRQLVRERRMQGTSSTTGTAGRHKADACTRLRRTCCRITALTASTGLCAGRAQFGKQSACLLS